MLNNTVIIGRLVSNPKVEKTDNGKKVMNMTLAVPRSYKNAEGVHEADFIDCVLWNGMAENLAEYCQKGDMLGVKGKIQTDLYEKDGQKQKSTRLVAESITFLQPMKFEEKEEESVNKKVKEKGMEK